MFAEFSGGGGAGSAPSKYAPGPALDGSSLPRGAWAEIHNFASWRLCFLTHKIYMPSFIDLGPAVSEL